MQKLKTDFPCDDKSNNPHLCLHLSLVKPHICPSWISNMTAVPQRKGEGNPVSVTMQGGKAHTSSRCDAGIQNMLWDILKYPDTEKSC